MKNKAFYIPFLGVLLLSACKKDETVSPEKINTIPEFFLPADEVDYAGNQPELLVFATASDKVNIPQDLDFHPLRPMELWIINKDADATGGSTVTIQNAGSSGQVKEWRRDGNAWHFMALPSAIAFSHNGNFATSANIKDANRQGGAFTGPTLWSSDLNIYAKPSGGNGSHLDMLHASPFGMGIAAETNNVFWYFDGQNGNLVRYDFVDDHGPGNDFHGDALVHRYADVVLKKNDDLPSHMVLDAGKKWLYIVDGGNNRILRVDIQSGNKKKDLNLINEPLTEYWEMENTVFEVLNIPGIVEPVGIEIKDGRLFISDYETGDILAFDVNEKKTLGRISTGKKGVTGIKIDPQGKLWYVNALTNEVIQVQPK
ncbi:MAG: NHL repeat-containing protein [Bacteroidia bacterium]